MTLHPTKDVMKSGGVQLQRKCTSVVFLFNKITIFNRDCN